jgi:hypothetical protein
MIWSSRKSRGFGLKVKIDPNYLKPGYILVCGQSPTRIRLLVGGGVGSIRSIKGWLRGQWIKELTCHLALNIEHGSFGSEATSARRLC